jgi:hypothetical protein
MRPVPALLGITVGCLTALLAAAPVRAEQRSPAGPALQVSAGVFALVESYGYPFRGGLEYRFGEQTSWLLAPGIGAAIGPDGMAFYYADLQRDFALGSRWFVSLSMAAGVFNNGDGIGVHQHLEFQPGIAFMRVFDGGMRVGLAGYHVSNGGLDGQNNGTEAIALVLHLPVGGAAQGR